jgi:GNAT superfamily N-acetyltransferase
MLSVYQADARDYQFIYPELLRAARKKHFLFDTQNPEEREFIKQNLTSVLKQGHLNNGLRGQPLVFEHQKNRIGFALVSEIRPGLGGHELHLFFVHHKYHRRGYGSAMLDEINHRWHQVDLYARCLPASNLMFDMLTRRGFVFTHTNSEGARVLLREKILLQA